MELSNYLTPKLKACEYMLVSLYSNNSFTIDIDIDEYINRHTSSNGMPFVNDNVCIITNIPQIYISTKLSNIFEELISKNTSIDISEGRRKVINYKQLTKDLNENLLKYRKEWSVFDKFENGIMLEFDPLFNYYPE